MSNSMRVFGKKTVQKNTDDKNEKKVSNVFHGPQNVQNKTIVKTTELSEQKLKERQDMQKDLIQSLMAVFPANDISKMNKDNPVNLKIELKGALQGLISQKYEKVDLADSEEIINEIIDDIVGLGPLEKLLAIDGIADIMVCGPKKVYIEIDGKIQLTDVKFRDDTQLINVCRRIVSAIGRRVDESSPICDARLADGSRVAIVAPPLSPDGTTLTIRKFKKEKFGLQDLVRFGSLSPSAAKVIEILSACRCNVLISGGTGSGKTTLLNCVTKYISSDERIITIEDAMELQLQQSHVVRWESRPANLEGTGEITIGDLLKAALRHRPERIIIGEIRGKEAFDLLQAMNTGHDGSAGTVHSNSPREAISRVESMVAMGGWGLPAKQVREQIAGSIDVVIQAARLRDGTRRVTHITEVVGMEGETVTTQDLMLFKHEGEDVHGKIIGKHVMSGIRPKFWEKARYYGLEVELMKAMEGE